MYKKHYLSEKQRKNLLQYLILARNDEVFTIEQLEGFLFCCAISSPFISLDDILASIFGDPEPEFDSLVDVMLFNQHLIDAQNAYIKALQNNTLTFPYTVTEDNLSNELIIAVQDWCYGFMRGIFVDYKYWLPPDKKIIKEMQIDDMKIYIFIYIIFLITYALHKDKLPVNPKFLEMMDAVSLKDENLKKNILILPDIIKVLIQYGRKLRDSYLKKGRLMHNNRNTIKKEIGRNDFCPCGSGKKYKKCCGRNI